MIIRYLKLEIALAIPASNDEKYNWNNSGMIELKKRLIADTADRVQDLSGIRCRIQNMCSVDNT